MAAEYPRRPATVAGIPAKHLTFVALVIQNAALVLLLRYSRVMPLVNGERYHASTAVFLAEVTKFALFLSMALYEIATGPQTSENSTISELSLSLSRAVLTGDSWKLAIPALVFVLQNTLQYVAAGNMDAAAFSVTYQLKIVSAACFGILLLGRSLNARRWVSLGLMMLGVAIVQTSHISSQGRILSIKDLRDGYSFHPPRSIWDTEEEEGNKAAGQLSKRSATYEGIIEDVAAANPRMNATIGLAAAVFACVISGFACTFFERTLKVKGEIRASVWVRNAQLSFYSIWPALFLGVLFVDGEHVAKTGFLTGYNWVVWLVVFLQSLGGILTALAINYSDSITKSFATSFSAVITFVVSAMFLEFQPTVTYLLGAATTCVAAFMYSTAEDKKSRPPPINVTQYREKSEPGYFDLEAVATAGKSPLRDPMREALSTSRPGTPASERRPLKSKSSDLRFSKRDQ